MRSAIQSVLVMSFAAWAVAGCVGEAPPPADLQATAQALQAKGVYYLGATGTAENAAFTFYDQNKVAIGDGRSSQDPQQTDIHWGGSSWESSGGAFSKDGVAGSAGTNAGELGTALSVFELSLDQAFPLASGSPDAEIQPRACPVRTPCSRPSHRCVGACTGWVCSQTDGTTGICINVH